MLVSVSKDSREIRLRIQHIVVDCGGWLRAMGDDRGEDTMVYSTFQIFFAGIFLEESFVCRRPSKVINHQNGNRLDIILGIACIE